MSIAQAVCPESETLRQFLQGRLPEAEAEGVEQHLAQCPACGDTLQALEAGDTLHDLVRAARQPLGEESVIDGLVARLRELPPPAGQADDPVKSAEPSESLATPDDSLAPLENSLAPLDALGPSGIRDERAQASSACCVRRRPRASWAGWGRIACSGFWAPAAWAWSFTPRTSSSGGPPR
jgi:hypothetical protein